MDLFHKIMELVDKNADKIPEGDYLELCGAIKALREQVKPPPFLLDQNVPLQLPSDPDEEWTDTTISEVSLNGQTFL